MRRLLLHALLASLALAPWADRGANVASGAPDDEPASPPARALAIVNPKNPASGLDLDALARILRADVQTWPGGSGKVVLVLPPLGSKARKVLLERVYRMSERELKRHFIEKLYGGALSEYPITGHDSESIVRSVERIEEAIGFVAADDEIDRSGVKVLRIDGRLPDDARYPLTAAP